MMIDSLPRPVDWPAAVVGVTGYMRVYLYHAGVYNEPSPRGGKGGINK